MPVDELAALLRVVTVIADLDPATAWELDAQLNGLAKVSAAFAEGLGAWGERLAEIGLHDSVTTAAAIGSDHLSQTTAAFTAARRNLRTVYAAQFAAAQAQVSQVDRRNFWGETPHGGGPASPSSPQNADDKPPVLSRTEAPRPGLRWTGLYEDQTATVTSPSGDWAIEWYDDERGSGWRATYLGEDRHAQAHCESLDEALDYIAEHSSSSAPAADGEPARGTTEVESGAMHLPDGAYVDWSCSTDDGGRMFELGDGDGLDANAVNLRLTPDQVRELREQLHRTLADEAEADHFVGIGDDAGDGYIDWSTPLQGGGRLIELGDGDGSAVNIELTRDELQALHDQLTADTATPAPAPASRPGPPQEDHGRPAEATVPTVPQPAVPAPSRSPEEIRPPNGGWGIDQGLMHFDGALGRLWNSLGDDQHLQVDGRALGNIITDLGEGISLRHHDTNHAVRELRRIRTQLPDGSPAARSVDVALARLAAPERPAPALPDHAPRQLKDLMAELNAIPLVRRGYDQGSGEAFHETDRLAEITNRWLNGEIGRSQLERDLESLIRGRHESSEGWTEIRVAVGRALEDFRQWARRPA
jgi:hypothetical protein